MATHPERPEAELYVSYLRPTTRRDALTGREGVPLGVEPIARSGEPDAEDGGLHRRARRLRENAWRSTPPPAA